MNDLVPNQTPISNCVLDNMKDYSDAELRVFLAVWRHYHDRGRTDDNPPTIAQLAETTGLNRIATAQAVRDLYCKQHLPQYTRTKPRSEYQAVKSPVPKELRERIFERDNYTCQECGQTDDLTIDHIKPQVMGGLATEDNLRVLCRLCNSHKSGSYEETEELFIK